TTANGVAGVVFNFGDPAVQVTATPVSGVADTYEAAFTVPVVADGTVIDVRAVATSIGGNSADLSTSFTVYAGDVIKTNTTISSTNTSFDTHTVYVRTSTLTISGHHEFARLAVLDAGTIVDTTQATTPDTIDIKTGAMFIACTGAIDATGKGYTFNKSYPGASLPANGSGGSH